MDAGTEVGERSLEDESRGMDDFTWVSQST